MNPVREHMYTNRDAKTTRISNGVKKFALIAGIALGIAPLALFAQNSTDTGFARNGVFGCNQTGAYSMSVGSLSAVGGVYVPVNDAAVTLNTGYLVYQQCVLRGIVDRIRENTTASIVQSITRTYTQGRPLPLGGHGAYFSQNIPLEQQSVYDKTITDSTKNGYFSTLNPAFQGPVQRAIYMGYMAARNQPNQAFECSYQGDITSALNGNPKGNYWDSVGGLMDPACNPYYAYYIANNSILGAAASNWNNTAIQLGWYNGNYPVTTTDPNGNVIVVTPGSVVGSNYLQAEQTGFYQLQNANDIDQMVGSFFAGITSQVIADQGGLTGITQSSGGQPSYLQRVVDDSLSGLRAQIANIGLQILLPAQANEKNYMAALQAIAQKLLQTISALRAKENQCWNLVTEGSTDGSPNGSLPHVCSNAIAYGSTGPTCQTAQVCTTDSTTDPPTTTCVAGTTLHIATSTVFSQAVINGNIAPLASSTAKSIDASQTTLGLIQNLITNIQKTDAVDAERQAIQQLDKIAAQNTLHTQYDAQNAATTRDNVSAQMDNLITNTISGTNNDGGWADSPDTTTGWCNVKNPSVIQAWQSCWTPNASSTCPWKQ